jgi:DNA-directed RNA polymerase subunit K/omega
LVLGFPNRFLFLMIFWAGYSVTEANVDYKIEIGPQMLTRFEYARIVGARALQISMGAPVLAEAEETKVERTSEDVQEQGDPLLIAEQEIKNRLLPILVRRTLPDGRYQDIPLALLLKQSGRKHGTIMAK